VFHLSSLLQCCSPYTCKYVIYSINACYFVYPQLSHMISICSKFMCDNCECWALTCPSTSRIIKLLYYHLIRKLLASTPVCTAQLFAQPPRCRGSLTFLNLKPLIGGMLFQITFQRSGMIYIFICIKFDAINCL